MESGWGEEKAGHRDGAGSFSPEREDKLAELLGKGIQQHLFKLWEFCKILGPVILLRGSFSKESLQVISFMNHKHIYYVVLDKKGMWTTYTEKVN